jgi:hypothetical protein
MTFSDGHDFFPLQIINFQGYFPFLPEDIRKSGMAVKGIGIVIA